MGSPCDCRPTFSGVSPPASTICVRRAMMRAASSHVVRRCRWWGLQTRSVAGSGFGGGYLPPRDNRQHLQPRRQLQLPADLPARFAARPAGRPRVSHRPPLVSDARVTATHFARPRAAPPAATARCGVTRRTDSANTKPIASAPAATPRRPLPAVVMPQIFDPRRAHDFAARAEHGARERAGSRRPHQRAADQRQVVAGGRDAVRIVRRRRRRSPQRAASW